MAKSLLLAAVLAFVGCGGRALPAENPTVACVECITATCDLCVACRDTGADMAASCPANTGAACEAPLPDTCVVQVCAECP